MRTGIATEVYLERNAHAGFHRSPVRGSKPFEPRRLSEQKDDENEVVPVALLVAVACVDHKHIE